MSMLIQFGVKLALEIFKKVYWEWPKLFGIQRSTPVGGTIYAIQWLIFVVGAIILISSM